MPSASAPPVHVVDSMSGGTARFTREHRLAGLAAPHFYGTCSPASHDARILTPHTTTNASIVNDATNNALSMEAIFITPPCASYPGATLGDSNGRRQPPAGLFSLWIASTICTRGTGTPHSFLSYAQ